MRTTLREAATSWNRSVRCLWRPSMRDRRRRVLLPSSWGLVLLEGARSVAEAAPTGPAMPWDGPLIMIMSSLSGTVAHVLVPVAVVVTGLVFAFTEHGSGARRLFGVALAGARGLGRLGFMTTNRREGGTPELALRPPAETRLDPRERRH